eukprot:GILK01002650.1.p1 GENE.GILK01002650.1~~GILK01002650.1.p1  ORF type:complete len:322 (+),score=14.98 GILK01002650.1:43-966(+)
MELGSSGSNSNAETFCFNGSEEDRIRDVWKSNLDEEMAIIRKLIQKYNYVAMDTEFPGVVARPVGTFKTQTDYHYQTVRCNVDLLKIIQLGLTFSDGEGNLAPGICTYQFNFKFNLSEDMYAQDSIDLLTRSGIDFQQHDDNGIDVQRFGELMTSSGLVLRPEIRWISFHSAYDFSYLLKLLTCSPLPETEDGFIDLLHIYFPSLYDIKYMLRNSQNMRASGLNKIAADLAVERIGPQHQAGSDSLVTSAAFFKLRAYFGDDDCLGVLYGLGPGGVHLDPQYFYNANNAHQSAAHNSFNHQLIDSAS